MKNSSFNNSREVKNKNDEAANTRDEKYDTLIRKTHR